MLCATPLIRSDQVRLIMNGDSYTDADLAAFAADYSRAKAEVSMLVCRPTDELIADWFPWMPTARRSVSRRNSPRSERST